MPARRKPPLTADGRGTRRGARDILLRVEQAGAFASILLDKAEAGIADRRDAALLHETVLGVLRHQSRLDHAIAAVSNRPLNGLDPEVRIALRIGAYGLLYLDRVPDFAAVETAVDLVTSARRRRVGAAAGFVNALLRRIAADGAAELPAGDDPEALALRHSHPVWWVERMIERLGAGRAAQLMEANNRPAPTVLRAHPGRGSGGELARRLAEDGAATVPCELPGALRLVGGRLPGRMLEAGDVWVQDEASQLVPALFGEPAAIVADLCAAPGSKTVQLATAQPAGGRVVAADRHAGRLRRLGRLVRRTGANGVLAVQADLTRRAPLRGPFPQVLVDAPCSGSGTLRRHPEIRWRLRAADLEVLASRQATLLRTGAALTAAGGSLVYSVCSLEPEEGEGVIGAFLDEHPGFEVADAAATLPAAYRDAVDVRGFLRTWPDRGGLDGFFAARLVRRR